jgi:hypothetical protein
MGRRRRRIRKMKEGKKRVLEKGKKRVLVREEKGY